MRTTSERRGHSPSGLTYPTGHPLRVRRVSRVTFFAFLGLGITFTKDLANPSRQLPRTVYLALAVAAINYVAIAFGVSAPDCEEGDLLRKYRTGAGRRPNGWPGGIPADEALVASCHIPCGSSSPGGFTR